MESDRGGDSQRQKLVVATLGHTAQAVEALHAVAVAMGRTVDVQHAGLSADAWYGGTASATYERLVDVVTKLPRSSRSSIPWWSSPDIAKEFERAIPEISACVADFIARNRPSVFVLADDNGPLEVLLIRLFERAAIPVVYVEHTADLRALATKRRSPMMWRLVRENVLGRLRRALNRSSVPHPSELVPRPARESYPICCYSRMSLDLILCLGVERSRLKETGYPWFDIVVRARGTHLRPRSRKKALIVSSGWALYGKQHRFRSDSFFELVGRIYEEIRENVSVALRPKPGELAPGSASRHLIERLAERGVEITDTSVPSYVAVQGFDVVFADVSTLILESMIVGVPTITLEHADVPDTSNPYRLESAIHERFGLITVSGPADVRPAMQAASSVEYLQHQNEVLEAEAGYLFPPLDGRCAERVAREVFLAMDIRPRRQP